MASDKHLLVEKYLELENSKEWFPNSLRVTLLWDDDKYLIMKALIDKILLEFQNDYLIPKDLVYFFSSIVDDIIGITKHESFFELRITGIETFAQKQAYRRMVETRVIELEEMRDEFLFGEI